MHCSPSATHVCCCIRRWISGCRAKQQTGARTPAREGDIINIWIHATIKDKSAVCTSMECWHAFGIASSHTCTSFAYAFSLLVIQSLKALRGFACMASTVWVQLPRLHYLHSRDPSLRNKYSRLLPARVLGGVNAPLYWEILALRSRGKRQPARPAPWNLLSRSFLLLYIKLNCFISVWHNSSMVGLIDAPGLETTREPAWKVLTRPLSNFEQPMPRNGASRLAVSA